jgi:hypothetical protein
MLSSVSVVLSDRSAIQAMKLTFLVNDYMFKSFSLSHISKALGKIMVLLFFLTTLVFGARRDSS